jgi:hypothetical protein
VYLVGTAHGTFIGTDSNQNLVQMKLSTENLSSMVFVENDENNNLIIPTIMADFDIDVSHEGISFVKNNKYLCDLQESTTIVVNRDSRGPWETFVLLNHEEISDPAAPPLPARARPPASKRRIRCDYGNFGVAFWTMPEGGKAVSPGEGDIRAGETEMSKAIRFMPAESDSAG